MATNAMDTLVQQLKEYKDLFDAQAKQMQEFARVVWKAQLDHYRDQQNVWSVKEAQYTQLIEQLKEKSNKETGESEDEFTLVTRKKKSNKTVSQQANKRQVAGTSTSRKHLSTPSTSRAPSVAPTFNGAPTTRNRFVPNGREIEDDDSDDDD